MGHLEGGEDDRSPATAPGLRATDVVTNADRIPPDQLKSANATDTTTLVNKGDIPDVHVDMLASGDAAQKQAGATTESHAHEHYPDILPSVDLQLIRQHRKSGGDTTNFTYQPKTAKGQPDGLSEADRENSIFYKIQSGEVDGTSIFQNASELFKTSGTGDARPTDALPRQQVPRDGKPPDRAPGQPETDGATVPGEAPKPGDVVPKPGEPLPPPYRSERLQLNPDGSASVPVKRGDTVWGIARETLRHGREPGYNPTNREIFDAVKRLAKENPQIKNPDRIQPNRDTIKIPKDMIREIQPQVAPMDGPKVQVENRGATPEFHAKMQKEVDQLPAGVRRLLDANQTKIVVGDKVSGVYPELAGVQPRGWPPGSTWDNADGLYSPDDKTAVVTERRVDDGKDVKNERSEGVMKHEIGHAVDHAMGNFSQNPEFQKEYDKDVAALSPADRRAVQYLLQPGNAGKSETFAEVFGALNGSSANPSQTRDILRQFPNVAALMQRKFAAM
ncbi:MAG: LysM peptidoglycan-binding domain-containing protein [Candidatus Melainabacteria bacterium]|nr:LysM peptidoglycan-binding domain-containing protein [Candidatus Melainabacteria bacterium]